MNATEKRKVSHVDVCLKGKVEARQKKSGFSEIDFVHCALPELDFAKIDAKTMFLGKKLKAPIIIEAITGGHKMGGEINRALAKAAQEQGIALGLGSQRAMLENVALSSTYKIRDVAPDVFIMGNIGIAQLRKYDAQKIAWAASTIDADALAVHLNPLQELVQPEGDRNFEGCLKLIERLCEQVPVSIIAKETGAGISPEVAVKLEDAGVAAIDVAGAGGTSWSGVEMLRSRAASDGAFWDWGIPTAVSTALAARAVKIPVICSGGVRSGVDVAKGIALGASLGGAALPFLRAWGKGGSKAVSALAAEWVNELKIAMALTGSRNIRELGNAKLIVTGNTSETLCAFGCFPASFISREQARRQ